MAGNNLPPPRQGMCWLGNLPSEVELHLNPASQLPPVDCPLLISVQGQLLRASRPTFAERKGDDLEYELTGGGMITGRFPWTYQ